MPDTLCEKNRPNGLARFTNRYLKKLSYGNKTTYYADPAKPYRPDPPAAPGYFFEAVFDYGEHDDSAPAPAAGKPRVEAHADAEFRGLVLE